MGKEDGGGGKLCSQVSSLLVSATAWTRIRCSFVFGVGVGRGTLVRVRVCELLVGWRRVSIVCGRGGDMMVSELNDC